MPSPDLLGWLCGVSALAGTFYIVNRLPQCQVNQFPLLYEIMDVIANYIPMLTEICHGKACILYIYIYHMDHLPHVFSS